MEDRNEVDGNTASPDRAPEDRPMPSQAATHALRTRLAAAGVAPLTPGERAAVVEVIASAVTTVDVARGRGVQHTDVGVLMESVDQLAALCAASGSGATTPLDAEDDDPRFTMRLVHDVEAVLREHGYIQPTDGWDRNIANARVLLHLPYLVRVFEGRAQR